MISPRAKLPKRASGPGPERASSVVDHRTGVPRPPRRDRRATATSGRAGREGRLVFLRCRRCGTYIHPPQPICPDRPRQGHRPGGGQRSRHGRHLHRQLPGLDARSGAAVCHRLVEIEEQPGLRLTTNIVNCAPDDVRIGMPVQVVFEHHEDPERRRVDPAVRTESGGVDGGQRYLHREIGSRSPASASPTSGAASPSTPSSSRSTPAWPPSTTPASATEDIDGLSTYPGRHAATAGVQRRRRLRGHRRPPAQRRLVRRRPRDVGPARLGDEGLHGRRSRDGEPRACASGPSGRAAPRAAGGRAAVGHRERGGDRPAVYAAGLHRVDPAVRVGLRRVLDRHVRPGPHAPLRHHRRAAGPDRAQRAAERRRSTRRPSTATRSRWTTTWRRG